MINMMMAINKDNFEGHREVTCYSCHRGSTDPVSTPIISDEEPRPAGDEGKKPGKTKASLPAADQLLDKYPAAIGGTQGAENMPRPAHNATPTPITVQYFSVRAFTQ